LVYAGICNDDEEYAELAKGLVKKWTSVMPQLQSVYLTHGYCNSKGHDVTPITQDHVDTVGRQVLVMRNKRGRWRVAETNSEGEEDEVKRSRRIWMDIDDDYEHPIQCSPQIPSYYRLNLSPQHCATSWHQFISVNRFSR
jgi:hypothetical protein